MDKLRSFLEVQIKLNKIEDEFELICKKYGITLRELFILQILYENKKLNITELKQYKFGENTGMSQHIKKLQVRDLVDRKRSKNDDRVVEVNIKDKGIKVIKEVKEEIEENKSLDVVLEPFIEI
ncbi:MarR family winged helix-turn-helix transcriptional regulator [Macrococcus epidermidis]|uniref:MarR family winged helix-turn-helix transcriptional regulator n=1 Tax=Macrococcus epidermidis TaxID=1902580 RepID=UPI0014727A8D|nr:MarR family transcriptional regulator [Macrococcus epidermidis]